MEWPGRAGLGWKDSLPGPETNLNGHKATLL